MMGERRRPAVYKLVPIAARVARQKQPLPLITARIEPESRPAEATVHDLLRWLDRRATRRPVYGDTAVR